MAKNKGYVKIHRSIMDQDDYHADKFCRPMAWIHLIMIAQHKQGSFYKRGIRIKLTRGQIAVEMKTLAKAWKWSIGKVERFIKEKQTDEQIYKQPTNVTTLLSILNYERYQGSGEDSEGANDIPNERAKNDVFQKNTKKTGEHNSGKKGERTAEQKPIIVTSLSDIYISGDNTNGLADQLPPFEQNGLVNGLANGLANGLHLKNVEELKNVNNKNLKKNKTENTMQSEENFLLAEMHDLWKEANPDYPADFELDYPPILKIAKFLAAQEGITDILDAGRAEILALWKKTVGLIVQDDFYGSKPLKIIAAHIQNFYNKQSKKHPNGKQFAGAVDPQPQTGGLNGQKPVQSTKSTSSVSQARTDAYRKF